MLSQRHTESMTIVCRSEGVRGVKGLMGLDSSNRRTTGVE